MAITRRVFGQILSAMGVTANLQPSVGETAEASAPLPFAAINVSGPSTMASLIKELHQFTQAYPEHKSWAPHLPEEGFIQSLYEKNLTLDGDTPPLLQYAYKRFAAWEAGQNEISRAIALLTGDTPYGREAAAVQKEHEAALQQCFDRFSCRYADAVLKLHAEDPVRFELPEFAQLLPTANNIRNGTVGDREKRTFWTDVNKVLHEHAPQSQLRLETCELTDAYIKDQQRATDAVLQRHGITAKEFQSFKSLEKRGIPDIAAARETYHEKIRYLDEIVSESYPQFRLPADILRQLSPTQTSPLNDVALPQPQPVGRMTRRALSSRTHAAGAAARIPSSEQPLLPEKAVAPPSPDNIVDNGKLLANGPSARESELVAENKRQKHRIEELEKASWPPRNDYY